MVLAATTFLLWAKVGTNIVGHETPILGNATQVHGIETVCGLLTLIMAVGMANVLISVEFT
ncbi:hypothetical protein [Actinomadura nitritigenes]|uniref:hypothetical protein n=1 Tax=Actinomadura nitritigenes TaxID=134602 RepID=UPI003D93D345